MPLNQKEETTPLLCLVTKVIRIRAFPNSETFAEGGLKGDDRPSKDRKPAVSAHIRLTEPTHTPEILDRHGFWTERVGRGVSPEHGTSGNPLPA